MRSRSKLNVRLLPAEDEFPGAVLIEGDRTAVEWFGRLVLKHAKGNNGCGFQMFPHGSPYFARTATMGFYLHLLPCDHPTEHSEIAAGRKLRKKAKGHLV